jgi:hypothetical protein
VLNIALWLAVGIWMVPVGTPRLVPLAVGTVLAPALAFIFHLLKQGGARSAARNTAAYALFCLAMGALTALWILSGSFPGGAYS